MKWNEFSFPKVSKQRISVPLGHSKRVCFKITFNLFSYIYYPLTFSFKSVESRILSTITLLDNVSNGYNSGNFNDEKIDIVSFHFHGSIREVVLSAASTARLHSQCIVFGVEFARSFSLAISHVCIFFFLSIYICIYIVGVG